MIGTMVYVYQYRLGDKVATTVYCALDQQKVIYHWPHTNHKLSDSAPNCITDKKRYSSGYR